MSYAPIILVSVALFAILLGIGLLPPIVSRALEKRRARRRARRKKH